MVSNVTDTVLSVGPGEALALPRRAMQTVCAIDHALWLSQQGRPDDIVLAGGQCVTLNGRALIVVQALGQRASLRICQTPTPRPRFVAHAARQLRAWFGKSDGSLATGRAG